MGRPRIRSRRICSLVHTVIVLLVPISALIHPPRHRALHRHRPDARRLQAQSGQRLPEGADWRRPSDEDAAASASGAASAARPTRTYSARTIYDNGLAITTDEDGKVTARPKSTATRTGGNADPRASSTEIPAAASPKVSDVKRKTPKQPVKEFPPRIVPTTGFNVVLTHCTADFDSLASAVGLAKLWSAGVNSDDPLSSDIDGQQLPKRSPSTNSSFDSASHVPTFVVLPRGAHPGVHRFLALHKHLFPIRGLKSLPADLSNLNRLALVDAQRRDRLGPAESLLQHAKRITVVDHHIDQDSDIHATDYVVDRVGSVSTMIVEHLRAAPHLELTEAEATLLALGIHADTGSLCFDSTTPRDAAALAWCLAQGASQAAIAEHAHASLSEEQQGVLTQAMIHANATRVHGVTLSTVLLSADGFIHGLAAVTQDALELSSSDVFLLGLVYESSAGGRSKSKKKRQQQREESQPGLMTRLLSTPNHHDAGKPNATDASTIMYTEAWRGGEEGLVRKRLRAAFDRIDRDGSGYLDKKEVVAALASTGMITSVHTVNEMIQNVDANGDGRIDFEEFVVCARAAETQQQDTGGGRRSLTMIIIGRVKAGMNMRAVKLNKLFERYGGGGHPKAASATVRLQDESEAEGILQSLVDEIAATSLKAQALVGDFMTSPVLSVQPHMTERQVEDLFVRYDVRALPVCDKKNDVIGIVTYKEVAAAKQRLWNKEQKRLRQQAMAEQGGKADAAAAAAPVDPKKAEDRKSGTPVKAWMLQHVQTVEVTRTMAEVESLLFETDVGCIPVVAEGTRQLMGMVTRTDVLRQHRYYPSLHYHNKGFADSLALRSQSMIKLRKILKKFDKEDD